MYFYVSAIMQIMTCQILSSTLLEGQRACPGREVNFTCMTNGSLVMVWTSDEYIGINGAELEFTSADGVGSMMRSSTNPSTVATLVSINGTRVTESVLSITVLDFPTASVTYSDVGRGTSTITFRPLGMWLCKYLRLLNSNNCVHLLLAQLFLAYHRM